jgi:DNA integrity scanning protein DisA with diadenylate cyclase activity
MVAMIKENIEEDGEVTITRFLNGFNQEITNVMEYNDAQNQMKKKTKRKSPSPTLGDTIDHFEKTFQRQKVRKQALVILSPEIP